jgi:hypothetical protein
VDSSGFVKSLSTDEIVEIVRTESEDFEPGKGEGCSETDLFELGLEPDHSEHG